MSQLTTAKIAAAADLASAKATITEYIGELEASVNANKKLLIGVGTLCLLLGAAIGHVV